MPYPKTARLLVELSTEAVAVATAAEPDTSAFDAVTTRLAAVEHVPVVLGAVIRTLLEDTQPGGLTAEGAQGAVTDCYRAFAESFPQIDPAILVGVIGTSLGIMDAEDQPGDAGPVVVVQHAVLIVAFLLNSPLSGYLDAALSEILRAETIEMP